MIRVKVVKLCLLALVVKSTELIQRQQVFRSSDRRAKTHAGCILPRHARTKIHRVNFTTYRQTRVAR